MSALRCPPGFERGCTCDHWADTPAEDCGYHGGGPDPRRCEYCSQFVASDWRAVCKRCGWRRTRTLAQAVAAQGRETTRAGGE